MENIPAILSLILGDEGNYDEYIGEETEISWDEFKEREIKKKLPDWIKKMPENIKIRKFILRMLAVNDDGEEPIQYEVYEQNKFENFEFFRTPASGKYRPSA